MFLILFLLFTLVPALELYLLIQVGSAIGVLETIWIVVVTGIIGAALARSQGHQLFTETRQKLAQGNVPANTMIEGLMIFVGGILLITPGFITDIFGLSLVFPLTRKIMALLLSKYFEALIKKGTVKFHSQGFEGMGKPGGFYYSSTTYGQQPGASGMRDVTPNSERQVGPSQSE